jgi:hypothetical protein
VAIPLAGAAMIAPIVFIVLIGLAGLPHLLRRRTGPRLAPAPKGLTDAVATLVYVLMAAAIAWLAVISAAEPAGWLLSPATLVAAWCCTPGL